MVIGHFSGCLSQCSDFFSSCFWSLFLPKSSIVWLTGKISSAVGRGKISLLMLQRGIFFCFGKMRFPGGFFVLFFRCFPSFLLLFVVSLGKCQPSTSHRNKQRKEEREALLISVCSCEYLNPNVNSPGCPGYICIVCTGKI